MKLRFFLYCALSSLSLVAHDDDPKLLDRQPPVLAEIYRQAEAYKGTPNFPASGVTLLSWLPLNSFGSFSSGNDCWGYTSPSGREYALMGLNAGTAFVEVTDPANAQIISVQPGPNSMWRDVKVYGHHAYVVSEGGSGIQVFDLAQIDNGTVSLVNTITTGPGVTRTHNVAINTESGYLYRCGGTDAGLRIYSLANPAAPTYVAQWSDRYVHDAQIVNYTSGPYAGREIAFACAGFNGGSEATGLSIIDVTDKNDITVLAHLEYPFGGYSHQGWLSEDRRYFYLNDEFDEMDLGINTTTHIIDVQDLSNPVQAGTFSSGVPAIDHNLYVKGNLIFEANYRSGMRVFDAADPIAPVQVAFFDTYPASDSANFNGLWSVFPFFNSGVVIGSDLERGLFVWRIDNVVPDEFDLNGDLLVNEADYGVALSEWEDCCNSDFNHNGATDILDLMAMRARLTP